MSEDGKKSLPSLRRLCSTVTEVLNESNNYVFLARDRYEQAFSALQIFKAKDKKYEKPKCTCFSQENDVQPNLDVTLIDKVSETIRTAQIIRTESKTKISTNISAESLGSKKDTLKKRTSQVNLNLKESKQKSNGNAHAPSCPLYDFKVTGKHINAPVVPAELIKCVKLYHTYISNVEGENKTINKNVRNAFLKELDEHNEDMFNKYKAENPIISFMPKYFVTLSRIHNTFEEISKESLYFIYSNAHDLIRYQNLQISKINEDSWNKILDAIVEHILPNLSLTRLKRTEKMYFYKIIKTIYNFTRSNNPHVPMFKIK